MNDWSAGPQIQLRGVRVHNLKNVDVDVPRGALVAVCGVSGSGKTSLAIDTLYAEGQRRYIESFSAYTRQFLDRLDKPDFDRIDGLTPALAVTRNAAVRGNRSTVGTASESLDYLRLLLAKVGRLVCYSCGRAVEPASPQSTAELIQGLPEQVKLMIVCPVRWQDITDRATVLAELQQQGFVRLIASGTTLHLADQDRTELAVALPASGMAWVVIDRMRGGQPLERSSESLETAFALGQGEATLLVLADDAAQAQRIRKKVNDEAAKTLIVDQADWLRLDFSQALTCPNCQIVYPPAQPQLFSFNSPLGACPKCEGFGDTIDLDMDLIIPDRNKSIAQGAVAPWNMPSLSGMLSEITAQCQALDIPIDVPFHQLTEAQVALIRDGDSNSGFLGLAGFFQWMERKKYKMHVRVFLSRWRSYDRCDQCHGARLKPEALAYQLAESSIAQLCALPIVELDRVLCDRLRLTDRELQVADVPLKQLRSRLGYLSEVGLGYLTLDRTLRTLSGGEAQRTSLTTALGSSLVNMLYVLDEPSVGLHPHDVQQLAGAIESLTTRGNTVVMIEHEEALLDRADWIIEVGPGAGSAGGVITYSGPRDGLEASGSLTGSYLSGKRVISVPCEVRKPCATLELTGCRGNNLRNIDVEFPLGVLCLITGVSGSGKSTLVQDTLYGAVANRLTSSRHPVLAFDSLLGLGNLDDCLMVDQSPISRSPRSNPVTYVKAFEEIRKVFGETVDSKVRGFSAGHFSFNSPLGRCPRCEGDGVLQIDMQFLADIFMTCPECKGSRYRSEILQVRYRDQSVADVLKLTVRDALSFFRGQIRVQHKLQVLSNVGLDYLQLGQSATTLSAGEAQRLKLAGFLASASRQKTLFILDEPTTGLHTHDIIQLQDCFDALLAAGHSMIIVEHNLHLMAAADHIIDIGPGPALAGGRVVVAGTPAEVAKCAESITGQHLAEFLKYRNRHG